MAEQISFDVDNRPIGLFDSGLGGLTVLAALRKQLPNESIVYLGDTARVPYGNKSKEAICQFAAEDCNFLLERGVKIVMAACNTVSAVALDKLRFLHPNIQILGVIEAGIKAVIDSGANNVAVLGTRATISSDMYRRGIHKSNRAIAVESIACPLLVPLAEEGVNDEKLLFEIFDLYLKYLRCNPPDALLLGCTHYPLFCEALNEYFAGKVKIIDSATACAQYMADFLKDNTLAASSKSHGSYRYFVTDMPSEFVTLSSRFLGNSPGNVEKVILDGKSL